VADILTLTLTRPTKGEFPVSIDTPIIFRLRNNIAMVLANLNVTILQAPSGTSEQIISSGVIASNWSGKITQSLSDTEMTVELVRPLNDPLFKEFERVVVKVDI